MTYAPDRPVSRCRQAVLGRASDHAPDASRRGTGGGPGSVGKNGEMPELRFADATFVACSPEALYDLVSDVTRMGEWSPICRACWWDDGAGPSAGSWFTGRNETPDRTWETRSQVATAEPGREFAFVVGGDLVRWSYTFTPVDGGTRLGEEWEFLPAGIARFHDRYGTDADAQIADRTAAARSSIPATLAAIKKTAEAG